MKFYDNLGAGEGCVWDFRGCRAEVLGDVGEFATKMPPILGEIGGGGGAGRWVGAAWGGLLGLEVVDGVAGGDVAAGEEDGEEDEEEDGEDGEEVEGRGKGGLLAELLEPVAGEVVGGGGAEEGGGEGEAEDVGGEEVEDVGGAGAVDFAQGDFFLSAGYFAGEVADEAGEGEEEGDEEAEGDGGLEAAGVGVEVGDDVAVGGGGEVGVVGQELVEVGVELGEFVEGVEADDDVVEEFGALAVEADAGAGVGGGEAAEEGVFIDADDGVWGVEGGADDALAEGLVPAGELLHALLEGSADHGFGKGVGVFCEGSA